MRINHSYVIAKIRIPIFLFIAFLCAYSHKLERSYGNSFARSMLMYTFRQILHMQKVVFELETTSPVSCHRLPRNGKSSNSSIYPQLLMLKGQMKYVDEMNVVMFLCNPM